MRCDGVRSGSGCELPHLSVLGQELVRLNQPKSFVHVPPDAEVVDRHLYSSKRQKQNNTRGRFHPTTNELLVIANQTHVVDPITSVQSKHRRPITNTGGPITTHKRPNVNTKAVQSHTCGPNTTHRRPNTNTGGPITAHRRRNHNKNGGTFRHRRPNQTQAAQSHTGSPIKLRRPNHNTSAAQSRYTGGPTPTHTRSNHNTQAAQSRK